MRESSKDALALTRKTMTDAKSRAVIMDLMTKNPNRDYTRGEIAEALDIPINRITPRVQELIKAGQLDELGRRKSPLSRVKCHAVKLAETQQ